METPNITKILAITCWCRTPTRAEKTGHHKNLHPFTHSTPLQVTGNWEFSLWPLCLAVVGVLHQQHFSAIENHFQKNKCQMETPNITKTLAFTCW